MSASPYRSACPIFRMKRRSPASCSAWRIIGFIKRKKPGEIGWSDDGPRDTAVYAGGCPGDDPGLLGGDDRLDFGQFSSLGGLDGDINHEGGRPGDSCRASLGGVRHHGDDSAVDLCAYPMEEAH